MTTATYSMTKVNTRNLWLGALGAGWLTGYLDYVLFPVLFIFLGLTAYGLYRQTQSNPAPK